MIVAFVQARLGSMRLPNKVLATVSGKPMIELLLKRLSQSNEIDKIIVLTTVNIKDDTLQNQVEALGFECFRGSEDNVLNRYYEASIKYQADVILRITGDCPLVDANLVDVCVQKYRTLNVDYLSNLDPATYPDGLDIEVFSRNALERCNIEATSSFDKEHVTSYIRNSSFFKKAHIKNKENLSNLRWTVDESEDLIVIRNIFEHFAPDIFFDWKKVLKLEKLNPSIFMDNKELKNNEGLELGSGQKLYKRAKKVIPGGNMLLSKRPEMFLPNKWPSYFSRSKGCKIWDLDDNEYIDVSLMGIGTNILGYGHPEVDDAVKEIVDMGNMSTLNCPEEVLLCEKLVAMHPWASMAKLARTGGEANSIAVRIARAFTGKDKIAICGYHGWHDWYISSNLNSDQNLDEHLLPGLKAKGVPRGLAGTTIPFQYNNIEQLEEIIHLYKDELAAIKMEVSRNSEPNNNFLENVRNLASSNNILLIFDECTSGFRETFGGLHKKYNVDPDLAIFGKALGNGYAITACIGKEEVMQAAQSSFISSTFWTERIGPAAALKVLEIMERENSWEYITEIGIYVRDQWRTLANKYDLDLINWGIPALSGFSINSINSLAYKTLITQEMLKKGYIAGNSVYVCTHHTKEIIDDYIMHLDPIFAMIKDCEVGMNIDRILDGPVCHGDFKRLN
ncbi:MAG: aminotransferase class III-fold pyridoxal phosphate-dependent enzyme [Gammaproteobacteria bacterium]